LEYFKYAADGSLTPNHSMNRSLSVIFKYIGSYYRNAFNIFYLAVILALLAPVIYYNYQPHSAFRHFITGRSGVPRFVASYLLYFIPFLAAYLLQLLFYKNNCFFKNKWFCALLLIAPAFFALRVNFNLHQHTVASLWEGDHYVFWYKCVSWIVKAILLILLVYLVWFFKDRKHEPFYGSRSVAGSLRPYWLLLVCMAPLIALAATRPDFLHIYPRAQFMAGLHLPHKQLHYIIYELCYGFDFISIEVFFRGFLVIAFMRIGGMHAIVPAACFYCCIHLDKPMAEAISSFWGGLLLGIIAYHTKSVRGSVMIHLGIAWLMELAGFAGHVFF
jgi:uncharacterized membrane protein